MDLNSYLLEDDFEQFCRYAYERVPDACDSLGIVHDDNSADVNDSY